MAIRVRLDPIAKDLRVLAQGGTEKERQELVARFARDEIAKADEINRRALGRTAEKSVTVDGRRGAALNTVKADGGIIVAEWNVFVDVLVWIYHELVRRSPRVSGEYIKGHRLFADGAEVSASERAPPPASEYTFLNLVPYARKIEIGKTKSGRDFVIQVPNRIYERVAQDARSRFGNVADIRFSYRETIGAYRVRHGRRGGSEAMRAPAIIVKLKGA